MVVRGRYGSRERYETDETCASWIVGNRCAEDRGGRRSTPRPGRLVWAFGGAAWVLHFPSRGNSGLRGEDTCICGWQSAYLERAAEGLAAPGGAVTAKGNENKTSTIKQKYSQTAQAFSILLTKAVQEAIPSEQGPAVQYITKYLKDNGYKCYVEIFQSRKHRGKFAVAINRYASEVKFNKDKFTEIAIIAVASLAERVSWKFSDLFFDYSAIFEIKNRSVGWAIISVDDCVAARDLFMSANNIDQFTTFWKSKIQYISNADPQPIL